MSPDNLGPAAFLAAMVEGLAKLPSQLWQVGIEDFAGLAEAMDAAAVQLECPRVGLVADAETRGIVDQSDCPSVADWLMEHSFHLEPADATRTAKLARACQAPANQAMDAAAVASGTVTVRKAATALGQLKAVEHDLAPGKREEALASLTQMAQSGYDRHVIAVGRALMALLGVDRALQDNEKALRALACLRLSPLENGMLAIHGQLDPEAGAILSAALDPQRTQPHHQRATRPTPTRTTPRPGPHRDLPARRHWIDGGEPGCLSGSVGQHGVDPVTTGGGEVGAGVPVVTQSLEGRCQHPTLRPGPRRVVIPELLPEDDPRSVVEEVPGRREVWCRDGS